MRKSWMGFDGRVFLTEAEHETYLRRPPVRYAADSLSPHDSICQVCGLPETEDNPLQASHRVPFGKGVRVWRLTPDWLDSPENLVWAHRKICNKAAEIPDHEVAAYLMQRYDVTLPAELSSLTSTASGGSGTAARSGSRSR